MTMKKLSFPMLGLIVLLSSCMKEPKPEPVGEAKVRFTNAVLGSAPQDVYQNGVKMSVASLAYGDVSGYQTITSGSHFFGFTDNGTKVSNYEAGAGIDIGQNFTVIYYANIDGSKNIGFLLDDMTAPPAGKAKVRFLHLNKFFPNHVTVAMEGGADLASVIPFAHSSAYFNVNAESIFEVKAAGLATNAVIDANIQAGKTYTIWLDGTATSMTSHSIFVN
ncbi:MAG: DUF4397 domain-containing protein [Pedobacter sp.]|nr:MAG: DUF4397 domain-containing protein [Pedobacter sp.]